MMSFKRDETTKLKKTESNMIEINENGEIGMY